MFLKYGNFISKNINEILNLLNINTKIPFKKVILPLGISYYTLQALSYIVDVYRGKYKAEKNWGKIALFLSFFLKCSKDQLEDMKIWQNNYINLMILIIKE